MSSASPRFSKGKTTMVGLATAVGCVPVAACSFPVTAGEVRSEVRWRLITSAVTEIRTIAVTAKNMRRVPVDFGLAGGVIKVDVESSR
ncbi:MAG: hypothetical protein JRF15_09540, partial [Deltaproteobacteria bacterium]|nr:hypothetical protein [Deltaproteobacteria bacterium]